MHVKAWESLLPEEGISSKTTLQPFWTVLTVTWKLRLLPKFLVLDCLYIYGIGYLK